MSFYLSQRVWNNAHGAIAVIDKLLALGVAVSDVDGYVNDMAKQARENGFDKLAQLFESDAIYSTYPFDSLAAIAVDPLKTNNDFLRHLTFNHLYWSHLKNLAKIFF